MKLRKKTKFWMIVSAIATLLLVLLVSWIVRSVKNWRWHHAGPIENHPVRIYDVQFAKEFNDLNEVQLATAQSIGVPPVKDREAAEHLKGKLVEITDSDLYSVDELTHSIPFLIPSAADLLERIGRNFQDSLTSKGLNPNKLFVTSVLRTEDDVRKLRQGKPQRLGEVHPLLRDDFRLVLLALRQGSGTPGQALCGRSARVSARYALAGPQRPAR